MQILKCFLSFFDHLYALSPFCGKVPLSGFKILHPISAHCTQSQPATQSKAHPTYRTTDFLFAIGAKKNQKNESTDKLSIPGG